jgi:hypothetical protein
MAYTKASERLRVWVRFWFGFTRFRVAFVLLVGVYCSLKKSVVGSEYGHTQNSLRYQKGFEFGFGDSGLVLPGSEPLRPLFFFLVLIVP